MAFQLFHAFYMIPSNVRLKGLLKISSLKTFFQGSSVPFTHFYKHNFINPLELVFMRLFTRKA